MEYFGELAWWYVVVWAIGMAVLPIVNRIWSEAFDGGYAAAKIAGLAIISYITLVLGTLRITTFNSIGLWVILLILGIICWTKKVEWKKWMLIEELIFVVVFGIFVYLRGINPSITPWSSEKKMDYMIMKSIINTSYFPPLDSWMSGETINYYYFGHLVWAGLIKMTGVLPEVGYNLSVATLAGISAVGMFGVAGNLLWTEGVRKKWLIFVAGTISVLMLMASGNFQTIYSLIKNGVENYNYWDGVRIIPGTLNEFPTYSFLVGDLHSHINNLPFILLGLGLTIIIWNKKRLVLGEIMALGFLLAIFYMTSAPDVFIYTGLFSLIIGTVTIKSKLNLKSSVFHIFVMLATAIVLSLPFTLFFKPFGLGIGLVTERSPIFLLILLWGWIAYIFSGLTLITKKGLVGVWFVACVLFITIPEIVYMKDIYGGDFKRANTMFKFGYQVSVLTAAASGFLFISVLNNRKTVLKKAWIISFVFGAICVLPYSYFMTKSLYSTKLSNWDINGLNFIKNSDLGDYEAIQWIEKSVPKGSVIVEGVGDSYTESGRISAYTGRQTILGWPVHEWLWRGSYDLIAPRITDVKNIYESTDTDLTKKILDKYKVNYIVLGNLERQKYPSLNEHKLFESGKVVFTFGGTTIFEIQD